MRVRNTPSMMEQGIDSKRRKAFGAYYTPDKAVDFMISWAVRRSDYVIDPSYGDGNFLKKSVQKVDNPSEQIYGVEFDEIVYEQNKHFLADHQISLTNLYKGDFFSSNQFFENRFKRLPPFEAVVGNPPFIRYQRFKGEARERALDKAARQGVTLPGHASSWAPFLIHAVSLIKTSGRLAMVAPAELGHAAYARQVLAHLIEKFASIFILTFRKRLFPRLSEDTYIVLGSDKDGLSPKTFSIVDVEHEDSLDNFNSQEGLSSIGKVVELSKKDIQSIQRSETKLLEYLLEPSARSSYRFITESTQQVYRLGDLCDIKIGYVTGHNSFFHLSDGDVQKYNVDASMRSHSLRRSKDLLGISVTLSDWEKFEEPKRWLLNIPKDQKYEELDEELKLYLAKGEDGGVLEGFKVRKRDPWFSVPHVRHSDAFLTYMSTEGPRLVQNKLCAVVPNTLHTVDLKRLGPLFEPVNIKLLLVGWYTSLTFASAEIEGHSLGGGMLKLEPSEAKRLVIAYPTKIPSDDLDNAFGEIDKMLRAGDMKAALDIGDDFILRNALSFSKTTCMELRQVYYYLRDRRLSR